MKYDMVIVSHNSERWLTPCIRALAKLEYDLKQLNVIVVDNGSDGRCLQMLDRLQARYSALFGGFEVKKNRTNKGFGGGVQ